MSVSDPSKSRFVRRAIGPELGRALRAARHGAGLSLRELSLVTGLSASCLARLERGDCAPGRRTVLLLGAALELPPAVEGSLRELAGPSGDQVRSWIIVPEYVGSRPSRRFRRRLRRIQGGVRRHPDVILRAVRADGRQRRAGLSTSSVREDGE